MIYQLEKKEYERIIHLGQKYDSNFDKKFLMSNSNIYVYKTNERIIGFLITEKVIDEISIILLYVESTSRKQGVGSSLLDYLISNTKGGNRILLEVSKDNIAATSLYFKKGFQTINIRKKYYKDGSDALVMEKRLNNE